MKIRYLTHLLALTSIVFAVGVAHGQTPAQIDGARQSLPLENRHNPFGLKYGDQPPANLDLGSPKPVGNSASDSSAGSANATQEDSNQLVVDNEYKVGVDDVLDINILKPVTITSTVTVAPDGAITFPYIGNVQVKGWTLPKIQEEVQKRLSSGYMEYPVVSVSLKATRSKKFIIYGQVVHPGSYSIDENMTLLHAITEAGGFIVPGCMGHVKLLRPRTENSEFKVIESDIASILSGKNENVTVLANDTIIVSVDKYFVYGQIAKPGSYPVEENMTLLRAVTDAGGFIESGSTGTVKLLRSIAGKGEFKVTESNIKGILNGAAQNVTVLSGDTIVVSMDKFFVYGQVIRPGAYPVEENMTLLHAITLAGGFIESGLTGRVKLFRPKTANSDAKVIETNIKDVLSGANQNITVLPGDTVVVSVDKFFVSGQVNRPGAYPVEENMSLLHAITLAGGFTDSNSKGTVKLLRPKASSNDSEVISADMSEILNGAHRDVMVLPGDTIVVASDKFFVYGEVTRPGMYPLETNTSALTAISIAGGFSKFGSASRVKVLRMNGQAGKYDTTNVNIKEVIAGSSKADVLLQSGDIVVVSEGLF